MKGWCSLETGPGILWLDGVGREGVDSDIMDNVAKQSIVSALHKGRRRMRGRLVLGLSPPPEASVEIAPGSFKTRSEYRQALIDCQSGAQKERLKGIVTRLVKRGLQVHAYPKANSLVVEGLVADLVRALDEDLVETASFDEDVGLIEPVGGAALD